MSNHTEDEIKNTSISNFLNMSRGYSNICQVVINNKEVIRLPITSSTLIALQQNILICLELVLKNIIMINGMTEINVRKKYGHDLNKLHADCLNFHYFQSIPEEIKNNIKDIISKIGNDYKSHRQRYLHMDGINSFSDFNSFKISIFTIEYLVDYTERTIKDLRL